MSKNTRINKMNITASKIYDYIKCPHKVWRDVYGPQEEKIKEISPFVQLLWDRGVLHEADTINKMGEFVNIGEGSLEERNAKTLEAMKAGTPLIYQGVIKYNELLGIPDLLKKMPDGFYMPMDIKSGCGMEGGDEDLGDEGKPKKHYALQLCVYAEALIGIGFAKDKKGYIIDIDGKEVDYDLEAWWDAYQQAKNEVQNLIENRVKNKPAYGGNCRQCPWYKSCKKWCQETDDLSNIFYLGRSKRDIMNEELGVMSVEQLSKVKLEEMIARKKQNKSFLKGFGEKTLEKLIKRADLLTNVKEPVIYNRIDFPVVSYELYFDIEDDPTRDFVYMHGVYERHDGKERFVSFVAKDYTLGSEKDAWAEFWEYINSLPKNDFSVYYYSQHEKTTYKRMQGRYPDVVTMQQIEDFFALPNVIDLYAIIFKNTDWPLASYSLKDIAVYLGFKWRDETPSGALSIEWFNKYLENKDPKELERILLYNEDDCKATAVIKDFLNR